MVFICLQRWHRRGKRGPRGSRTDGSGHSLIRSYTGFTYPSLFCFVTDSALEDFVLMHCVFIPNGQLCPVLMAQYPFSTTLPNVVKCSFPPLWKKPPSCSALLTLFLIFNCCAPTMRRPRRALSRRSWTTHSTTSAGWSAWWFSGLLYMGITCRRRTSRWPS